MFRTLLILLLALTFASPNLAQAQDTSAPDRAATGGAQTLADIQARQRGEVVDETEGLLSSRDMLAVFGIANIRTVAKMRLEQGLPSIKTRGKHMFSPDEVLAWAKKARRHVNLRALWAGSGT